MSDATLSPEEVVSKPQKRKRGLSDADYADSWMQRVLANVKQDENGCWIWQGQRANNGYGSTNYRGKTKILHRMMYKVFHQRDLRDNEYVCHSCDVKLCCNPMHLWIGSNSDNVKDSARKGRHAEVKVTHCPRNHPYDAENTYITPRGLRNCKLCARIRNRLRAGWPKHLAETMGATPHGHRPVNARFPRKRKAA